MVRPGRGSRSWHQQKPPERGYQHHIKGFGLNISHQTLPKASHQTLLHPTFSYPMPKLILVSLSSIRLFLHQTPRSNFQIPKSLAHHHPRTSILRNPPASDKKTKKHSHTHTRPLLHAPAQKNPLQTPQIRPSRRESGRRLVGRRGHLARARGRGSGLGVGGRNDPKKSTRQVDNDYTRTQKGWLMDTPNHL